MKKNFAIRQLFHSMCAAGLLVLSSNAMASAFQLWEQDAASVGDYHSGRSAQALDASTNFYNSAGITRLDHQQLIVGDVIVLSNIKYTGTVFDGIILPSGVTVPITPPGVPTQVVGQGGAFSQIPNLHYVAPITQRLGFGVSVVAPFGLRTMYGANTRLRYAGTNTQLEVVDLAPSLAFAITPQFSVGAGFDYQRMAAEFDNYAEGTAGPITNTTAINKGHGYGWGYHLGALFQATPATRIGINFNSQVRHHVRGRSTFAGPLANLANGVLTGPSSIYNSNTAVNVTLPAYTTLSIFHQVNNRWDVKATAVYTRWSVFQSLNIYNISGLFLRPPGIPTASTTLVLSIPEHYRNTWNFAVGTDFAATDQITLRGGLGYDQSPSKNAYRNIQVPDGNRIAVAFGGHYQAVKTLGFDVGYTHLFLVGTSKINPPTQRVGAQSVTTNGTVQASADVMGASFTWDIT